MASLINEKTGDCCPEDQAYSVKSSLKELCAGLLVFPLPSRKSRSTDIPHAPKRKHSLSEREKKLSLRNALRYFPPECHQELAAEFAEELNLYGHVYMYRFLPTLKMKAYPIDLYPCKTKKAAAIMHMIMNNLDSRVAQFPEELVTYGGNGQVFSNWAQFCIVMNYLSIMSEEQTLVLYSGHPLGLFPSEPQSPRLVATNGMVVPNYSSRENYDNMYGQMTAGSYCYIGPQGIVHGTTLTILNSGRKLLNTDSLSGRVFMSSGLGGMSGAQGKASEICGCIGVIAEVSEEALLKRYSQGWLKEYSSELDTIVKAIREARKQKKTTSLGYLGNVVALWERLVEEYKNTGELLVDFGSDQTSCHNVFRGGYYPVGLSFEEAQKVMDTDPTHFQALVENSLRRHVKAINFLADKGMFFWDYGNAFLLEARRAGADVGGEDDHLEFRYPSYVQSAMGDIFSLGFGPFRWVCTSGDPEDLKKTDEIVSSVLEDLIQRKNSSEKTKQQYMDNIHWIKEAGTYNMVVGSQARILYSDQVGRVNIALAFNEAIRKGIVTAPIVISRDHHDVSGTDSPYRETSNITDGSAFCADMAVQNCIGDAFRGATWVALHNGGGVGWGEVINGGFGLVLDGSEEASRRAKLVLNWDVSNGVARRAWAGNSNAQDIILSAMAEDPRLKVTFPQTLDSSIFQGLFT